MNRQNIKKLYYSISEISDILDIKQSVIRYWEGEFKELKPQKNRAGNRIYKKDDIAIIRLIRHYMHEKHLSIQETKEMIMHLKSEDLFKRKLDELTPPEADSEKENVEITDNKGQEPSPSDDGKRIEEEKGEDKEDQETEDTDDDILFPVEEIPEVSKKDDLPEIVEKKDRKVPEEEQEDDVQEQEEAPSKMQDEDIPEEKEELEGQSRDEMRELLKKISANIRDIIDILHENK
jgi:DNA-binding transcriptional MerR regulator